MLKTDVTVLGGYVGGCGPDANDRDIAANSTILSGDLLDDDTSVGNTENSYHVVTAIGTPAVPIENAILDGFTITAGNANVASLNNDNGGGMYNNYGNPTIQNCTFSRNRATFGGGMMNISSNPRVINCVFRQNYADYGGGIDNLQSNPELIDSLFDRNESERNGGGVNTKGGPGSITITGCDFVLNMANTDQSVSTMFGGGAAFFGTTAGFVAVDFADCTFTDNTAVSGGGVYLADSFATFNDCIFTGNKATSVEPGSGRGGGAFLGGTTPIVTMRGCDFNSNTAKDGGGVYVDQPHVTFTLCSFIENLAQPPSPLPPAPPVVGSGGGVWARINGDGNNISANELRFYNTLFLRNEANDDGGGVYIKGAALLVDPPTPPPEPDPDFGFCTFVGNVAGRLGGGIYHEDECTGSSCDAIDPQVTSCILWDNVDVDGNDESAQIHNAGAIGEAVFRYNCIKEFSQQQPGPVHFGNISVDPRFLDPLGLDPVTFNDFFLGDGSPCIDAADGDGLTGVTVNSDLFGNPRAIDDDGAFPNTGTAACQVCYRFLDMGVYESIGEPYIVQYDPGTPFAEGAFDYIDPRMESSNGVNVDLGLSTVVLVFAEEVFDFPGGSGLTSAAFTVSSPNNLTIDCFAEVYDAISHEHLVLMELSGDLPLQQWTTIIAEVYDAVGNRIRTPITEFCTCTETGCPPADSPDRVVLGYLPADVDQNGTVGPFDVLRFRQFVNGVATPTRGAIGDYTDLNRNGVTAQGDPFDLLVLRQLANGVSPPATRDWIGESLPPRPCP